MFSAPPSLFYYFKRFNYIKAGCLLVQSQHQICFGLVYPLYMLKIAFIIALHQKDLNTDSKEKIPYNSLPPKYL